MRTTVLLMTLTTLTALPALADDCRYTEPRREAVSAEGLSSVRIDARAGFLNIKGRAGSSEVRVDGTACAARESDLDDIQLETRRRGDTLTIEVIVPDGDWSWNNDSRLDLTVEVPDQLALDIKDTSGGIQIHNVAALELSDGSGEIDIEGVSGDVRLDDGSGEIEIRDVGGNILIDEDGSGQITIADARGDVEIREDGSGSIDIQRVGGSVRVGSDGSGSIRAESVVGDFTVGSDGSGGIWTDDVGGRISIP